ncbi:MAG: hypothetical protein Ct9H300mP19_19130 [Dehalococcoidia bacterium]|nr:MAG: hypothetical protein Ct9H300mP19_19130 [Dehalococcoidia bacterium]
MPHISESIWPTVVDKEHYPDRRMVVASGFVLRAVAGSIAIDHTIIQESGNNVPLDLTISPWLYVVTALGAL